MAEPAEELLAYPDRILYDGEILTVNDEFDVASAVAIRDGRFLAVGGTDEIRSLAGPETTQRDLRGRTVVPGLVDSHVHVRQVGMDLERVHLFDATSIDEVLDAVREGAAGTPAGEWVIAGWGWHESQLDEKRLPRRAELDGAAPENPVFVPRGAHVAILNSPALERAGIDADTDDPEGGTIVRDPETGEPNGVLLEAAREKLAEPVVPDRGYEEFVADVERAMAELNSRGVTAALEPGLERDELRAFMDVHRRGDATLRVDALVRVHGLDDVEAASAYFGRDFGDDLLKIGGTKYVLDGGVEGARLREPYNVVEGVQEDPEYRGHMLLPPGGKEEFRELAARVAELGHQLQTHAVGDETMEFLADVYEEVDREQSIDDLRWTMVHVFLPTEAVLDTLEELDVHCAVQNHPTYLGQNMLDLWGEERAAGAIPLHTLLDREFVVGGGTDAPVVPWFPFESLWWMVTRGTVTAGTLGPEEAISREEALRLWTINAAYTMGWDDRIGSIQPGKRADLAVLDTDYLSCPADQIRNIDVELTMLGGDVVYESGP